MSGIKHDSEKPRVDLLSSIAMVEIAKVMTFGAKKYAAHNWRGGISWSRLLAAAMRHIFAFLGGESKDPETGLSHIAHASCCLMFLLEYEKTHPELDDRYKKSISSSSETTTARTIDIPNGGSATFVPPITSPKLSMRCAVIHPDGICPDLGGS